jgi:hypothetical protein
LMTCWVASSLLLSLKKPMFSSHQATHGPRKTT